MSTASVFEEDCTILRSLSLALVAATDSGDAKREIYQAALSRKHIGAMVARHGEAVTARAIADLFKESKQE